MRQLVGILWHLVCLGSPLFSIEPVVIADERLWIVDTYLPALKGTVLYIGVGTYTVDYYKRVQNPEFFETIDFLEERAAYGSPYGHYVGDFMDLPSVHSYDHVSFFGILGFNLPKYAPFETIESITQAIEKVDSLVKVGGTLQVSGCHHLLLHRDVEFWKEIFARPFFEKYEVVLYCLSPQNLIWWGKKIKE